MWQPQIAIALATYNGSAYLQAQLASLAIQTQRPSELVVGDDGSTDGTLDILHAFAAKAPFPVRIFRNASTMGFADNFLHTAQLSTADWIAFCDQDDVWLPHRLEQATHAVGSAKPDVMLVVQGVTVVDENLRPFRKQPFIEKYPRCFERQGQHGFWVRPGFCQTVRAALVRNIPWRDRPRRAAQDPLGIGHDRWTCVLANALGKTLFLSGCAALWRRHPRSTDAVRVPDPAADIPRAALLAAKALDLSTLSSAATHFAEALARLAGNLSNPAWAQCLVESSQAFERISHIKDVRRRIYLGSNVFSRGRALRKAMLLGAYYGHPFVRERWQEGAKDLVTCLGVAPRLPRTYPSFCV